MEYLIYRTQLEFHTGSYAAVGENQWIPETKLGHYVCLILVLLRTRGRRIKHEEKKKKPGAQGNHGRVKKHTAVPCTHFMSMTGSFAQFCL